MKHIAGKRKYPSTCTTSPQLGWLRGRATTTSPWRPDVVRRCRGALLLQPLQREAVALAKTTTPTETVEDTGHGSRVTVLRAPLRTAGRGRVAIILRHRRGPVVVLAHLPLPACLDRIYTSAFLCLPMRGHHGTIAALSAHQPSFPFVVQRSTLQEDFVLQRLQRRLLHQPQLAAPRIATAHPTVFHLLFRCPVLVH